MWIKGNWLACEVRDTGIGISPSKLETIFESFRQADDGLSRNYSGLGLGLALARKLTKLMQGEISVTSTLGTGSTFTVRLPLRAPADAVPQSAPVPRRRSQSRRFSRWRTIRSDLWCFAGLSRIIRFTWTGRLPDARH